MQLFNTASSDNIRDTVNLVLYELSLFFTTDENRMKKYFLPV